MMKHGNRTKPGFVSQNYGVQVIITLLVLVILVLFIFQSGNNVKTVSGSGSLPDLQNLESVQLSSRHKWNSFDSLVQFNPTVEFRNGTDVIWQIPESPKAMLFIAHGCDCRASFFWDRSSTCPNCIGLPEERLLVLEALSRKFAVITVSSKRRCWTMEEERFVVGDIIRWWTVKKKLDNLPLVALGASSGGYFVSALARDLRFSSITLMIAEGVFEQMDIPGDYPPTLFVHMPKDTYRQYKISHFLEVLKHKGIDAAEVECNEIPLSPTFFAERIHGVNESVSEQLFELFCKEGFVNDKGYLKMDGRKLPWKKIVSKDKTLHLDKELYHHVQVELNLAFGYHEMTSLQSEQIFRWFESHIK